MQTEKLDEAIEEYEKKKSDSGSTTQTEKRELTN